MAKHLGNGLYSSNPTTTAVVINKKAAITNDGTTPRCHTPVRLGSCPRTRRVSPRSGASRIASLNFVERTEGCIGHPVFCERGHHCSTVIPCRECGLVKRAVTMPLVPGARKLGSRRTNFAESKSDSLARLSGRVLSVEVPHMMPSSRRLAWPFGDRGYY